MYLCVLSHSESSESQVADGSENACGTFFRDGPPPKATRVKSPVDLQVFHPQGIFFNQARVIVQLCMYGYTICRSGGLPETWLSSWSEQCVASVSARRGSQGRIGQICWDVLCNDLCEAMIFAHAQHFQLQIWTWTFQSSLEQTTMFCGVSSSRCKKWNWCPWAFCRSNMICLMDKFWLTSLQGETWRSNGNWLIFM